MVGAGVLRAAVEMRAVTQKYYTQVTSGQAVLALGCDGGPLANDAHDPRCSSITSSRRLLAPLTQVGFTYGDRDRGLDIDSYE